MKTKIVIPAALAVVLAAGGVGYFAFAGGNPMDNARAQLAKGDPRAAAIEYRNAIKADPGNAEAHMRLSEMQVTPNDPVAA